MEEETTSSNSKNIENEQDTKINNDLEAKNADKNILEYLKNNMLFNQPNPQLLYPNINENEDYCNNNNNRYLNPYIEQKVIDHIESYLFSNYKNLLFVNKKNELIFNDLTIYDRFFVIKSFTEEDIHKSMKYGVWSSSKYGNVTLNKAFEYTKKNKKGNVYLFFSCNKSGRFCGVAKMTSSVDETKIFELWTQDNKWPGLFNVEWIFIKDVPLKIFKNICITMFDGTVGPVSHSRDTQEIPYNNAKTMMERFSKYENSNTIFEKFEFYDIRQEHYIKNKKMEKEKEKNNKNDDNKEKEKENNSANMNRNS